MTFFRRNFNFTHMKTNTPTEILQFLPQFKQMHLNPLFLHFSGPFRHLEILYQQDYLKRSLTHIRISLILACCLYGLFGVLDAILLPEEKYYIWAIRYGLVCPVLLLVPILSYFKGVQQWIQPILAGLIIIGGTGIILMILIAPPPVSYSYYAGLILIFIFGYTFSRARFIWASLGAWLVVLLYEIAAIGIAQTPWPIITNNNFFFLSANIIGMLACYSIELYDRRAFFLTRLLIEEKENLRTVKLAEAEKINAQKILGEKKKLALVSQIAGKMAHDFNNILGIIMGTTELSLLDCRDPGTNESFKTILDQTLRGKNLIKNLLAFAKDQVPNQTFFKLADKIDLVLSLLKKDLEGIQLIQENFQAIPDLLADPGMIEHALMNLIYNAIHATSKTDDPKITIRTYCCDDTICFEIEDNGCGIPREHLDAIYDPSFTLKGNRDVTGTYANDIKGSGYGMANVKKYMEQHQGSIRVSSTEGLGTKFTLCLPMIEQERIPEEKIQTREKGIQSKKHILLVEDEAAISNVQYRLLTQAPHCHKVDIADTGQVAMDLFDKNPYDFISLDYLLPGNLNGKDVYTHIRKKNKHIPILFVSGNIEFLESIKHLKQEDDHMDHLSKPCQNHEYVNRINKLLAEALPPVL
ncbi:MAG: hybrid sensor histidine kinase/response regulator [Desulfobacula sp.]|nr:hybrid sensor histidine kinase/response regulator [Desulfobacula sp.]